MALKFWRQQSIYEHKGTEAKCSEVLIKEKLFLNQVEQQSSVTRIQCARAFQTPLSFSSISFIVILMTLQHQPVIISTFCNTTAFSLQHFKTEFERAETFPWPTKSWKHFIIHSTRNKHIPWAMLYAAAQGQICIHGVSVDKHDWAFTPKYCWQHIQQSPTTTPRLSSLA